MSNTVLPYDIEIIKKCCTDKHIIWMEHSTKRMIERGIFRKEVIACLQNGEIIEKYPDDHPYSSCLVYGNTENNRPLHVVCSVNNGYVYIITVYEPSIFKWQSDFKVRKEKDDEVH